MLHAHTVSRKGVILLVVVSLLTLFSIVGLSFVMYANSEAQGAKLHRQSGVLLNSEVEPELLLSHFLGQLIYDVHDNEPGVYSALRGHSLLRTLYGWNTNNNGASTNNNNVPFNGTGRLHTGANPPLPPYFRPVEPESRYNNPFNVNDYYLINYTFFRNGDDPELFLRDPERIAPNLAPRPWRTNPNTWAARGPWTGGFNAPYTYPDLNNMFLAAVRADGTVLLPSFHRPWLFGSNNLANANWRDPIGKYFTLRPRPEDHAKDSAGNPLFPYPEDEGGDVKNLVGSPGTQYWDGTELRLATNDSYWVDLGFPVQVTPEGRKFKPLFAPLIVDLDSRINLSVHGNMHVRIAGNPEHTSNQGFGRWEVNPARLSPPGDVARRREWANLSRGHSVLPEPGRYGPDRALTGTLANPSNTGHFYSRIDYDGRWSAIRHSQPFRLPGMLGFSQGLSPFPDYPAGSYDNQSLNERQNHPSLYSPFRRPTGSDDATFFRMSNMEALLRYGETNSPALTSKWFRLLPLNLDDTLNPNAGRIRRLITTYSMDIDRPGLSPWVWDPNDLDDENMRYRFRDATVDAVPFGDPIPFRSLNLRPSPPNPPPPDGSEFQRTPTLDWRGAISQLPRIDLNMELPKYPDLNATTGRIDYHPTDPAVAVSTAKFKAAQQIRQGLAKAIFDRLRTSAGAVSLNSTFANDVNSPEFEALRWLAQIAVNIVDYVDYDDYSTPFNWHNTTGPNRQHWVYGTELPRVVLNEAYAEYTETTGQPTRVKVWVELHNPLRPDTTFANDHGAAQLHMPLASTSQRDFGMYQVILCKPTGADLRARDNVTGAPPPSQIHQSTSGPAIVRDYRDTTTPTGRPNLTPAPDLRDTRILFPAGDAAQAPPPQIGSPLRGTNRGYYLLGPTTGRIGTSDWLEPTLEKQEMEYDFTPAVGTEDWINPTIILGRLACPHLRPNDPSITTGQYQYNPIDFPPNPYLTVDYIENVRGQNTTTQPLENRRAWGRPHPYDATILKDQSPMPLVTGHPRHSFFKANVLGEEFFTWLVHLDRHLISPAELFHVSTFKPHELTQQFRVDAAWHQHNTAWNRQETRLYRALEYLETHDRSASMIAEGSVAKVRHVYPPLPDRSYHIVPEEIFPTVNRNPVPAMQGVNASGVAWRLQPGQVIVLDQGLPTEEVVVVQSPPSSTRDSASFRAFCVNRPRNGATITLTSMGDRVPGKININTIWDGETLAALCDPQTANNFTLVDIYNYNLPAPYAPNTVFGAMMLGRTPGLNDIPNDPTIGIPSKYDRPFLALTAGNSPKHDLGAGVINLQHQFRDQNRDDTLLRPFVPGDLPTARRLFDSPPTEINDPRGHPYMQKQLLTKIFNNLTTRSNVFAVWLTVGFFEVVDDTSRPVKLGAEIGRSENRHVRHRMFAVVDRTAQTASTLNWPRPTVAVTGVDMLQQAGATITPVPLAGQTPIDAIANIHPGAWVYFHFLEYDPVTDIDVPRNIRATVINVDYRANPPTFTANLPRDIPAGAEIRPERQGAAAALNNPGPDIGPNIGGVFRPRNYPDLVPYFSIIH